MDPVTVVLLVVAVVVGFVAGRGSVRWQLARRTIAAPESMDQVEDNPGLASRAMITPRPVEDRIGPATRVAIDAEVMQGRRIAAIRLYREATGAPLQQAVAAIDGWQVSDGPRAKRRVEREQQAGGEAGQDRSTASPPNAGDTWPTLPRANRQQAPE